MCTPTNELKFCTCKFGKRLPDNYWILHRFTTGKKEFIMGELACDFNHNMTDAAAIAAFIFASINKSDCFDKDLSVKDKDILEIHIVLNIAEYVFYYKFSKGKWIEAKNLNSFDIQNEYDIVSEGLTKPDISSLLKDILQ